METAVALRVFLASLESFRDDAGRALAVITGEDSPLRGLAASLQCQDIFTIPESIGGRFSVLTAVGLLPAAIMGLDIRRLLQGAAAMTTSCRENPLGENPVLDHAATGIIAETQHELTIRVLSVWNAIAMISHIKRQCSRMSSGIPLSGRSIVKASLPRSWARVSARSFKARTRSTRFSTSRTLPRYSSIFSRSA